MKERPQQERKKKEKEKEEEKLEAACVVIYITITTFALGPWARQPDTYKSYILEAVCHCSLNYVGCDYRYLFVNIFFLYNRFLHKKGF